AVNTDRAGAREAKPGADRRIGRVGAGNRPTRAHLGEDLLEHRPRRRVVRAALEPEELDLVCHGRASRFAAEAPPAHASPPSLAPAARLRSLPRPPWASAQLAACSSPQSSTVGVQKLPRRSPPPSASHSRSGPLRSGWPFRNSNVIAVLHRPHVVSTSASARRA